jgi:hypothetical protein
VIVPGQVAAVSLENANSDAGSSGGSAAWKWLAIGTGVAALGAGAWLIHVDGPIFDGDGNHTSEQYDTKGLGIGTAVGGAALIGAGVVLWLRGGGDERAASAGIAPTQGGLAVTYGGSF